MLRSRLGPYLRETTSSLRMWPSTSTSLTVQPPMYPSFWRISAMCVLSFEDGMTALSWYAWLAFRSRVSMSAIGSVIVMVCGASLAAVPHALGLGDLALGLSAISGTSVRFGQWVPGPVERSSRRNSPAGLAHAWELPGVSHLPEA